MLAISFQNRIRWDLSLEVHDGADARSSVELQKSGFLGRR
jgi:hypothetical protein